MRNKLTQNELWKPVIGFEKEYLVSDIGNIKSLYRNKNLKKWKAHGYYYSKLYKNKKSFDKRVGRLVAQAFILNDNDYPIVNHKNGCKSDDRVNNLEWCTNSHNLKEAFRLGLKSASGEKNSQAKLTKRKVLFIRKSTMSNNRLAKKYSIDSSLISMIKNNKRWVTI